MRNKSHVEPLPGLQTIQQREAMLLAPYAMHSIDSAGRKHPEPEHAYRGPFQRDRDRILHSAAFRRLSGKTQVFTGDLGDYHRTRLTHTHEVASIARTIGRALRLNEDLIEALALLHDIGHPPFGHAGQDALNKCLNEEGGFSHNRQALTIAEELEVRYHGFRGLNLTREVLDGQASRVDTQAEGLHPFLEVQVVDLADSITYGAHDTDDAVKLGFVTLDELTAIPLISEMARRMKQQFSGSEGQMLRKALVHELIDGQASDVLRESGAFLSASGFASADEARRARSRIGPSRELTEQKQELESFLYERVYRHPRLIEVRARAKRRLTIMFDGYTRRPELLPSEFQQRAGDVGICRSVGDYLAGMTDRFCEQQFHRYFADELGA